MSGTNEIINEIQTIFSTDTDIADFCLSNYGKAASVKKGELSVTDVPIQEMPAIIISDSFNESEKRRFLFNENEANLLVTCGILQNDMGKAGEELIALKELIKLALKKDPLLNGNATYSVVTKSKKLRVIPHPLYFMELTVYVNFKSS